MKAVLYFFSYFSFIAFNDFEKRGKKKHIHTRTYSGGCLCVRVESNNGIRKAVEEELG